MRLEKEETPMSMGRRRVSQPSLWVGHDELQRSPGHRFYETLNKLLREADFDRQVEALCAPSFASDHRPGRRSTTPGTYFRMHLIGYFEGIESERGRKWRCADSLSLRTFLGLELTDRVPDHSTLSRLRQRLPLAVHEQAFALILAVVHERGLLSGRVLGVDSTYLRADASMKAIVRRDPQESYAQFLTRLAEEAGIENPTAAEAQALDRQRKGKKTSNAEWASATDPEARIAKLKDGRTRLAYKPEHVVDLETGAITGVMVHLADRSDTETLVESLSAAQENLRRVAPSDGGGDAPPNGGTASGGEPDAPEAYGRRGRQGLSQGDAAAGAQGAGVSHRSPRATPGFDAAAGPTKAGSPRRRPSTRTGPGSGAPRASVSNENAASCSNGPSHTFVRRAGRGARRLRGRENVSKRYLLCAAAANLGWVLRSVWGVGTPRGWAERLRGAVSTWVHHGIEWILLAIRLGRTLRPSRSPRRSWRTAVPIPMLTAA
jgi:transposase